MGMDDSFPLPPRLRALLDDLPLAELAFAPVAVRPRHDGWSPACQRGFILRLALGGCVSAAARGVGKTRKGAYDLRARPGAQSFAAAWDKAIGWGRRSRLDDALERAILGEVRPVFYRGRQCGEQLRFNDGLTIAVLNAQSRAALKDKGFSGPNA